jgi:ABC-type phosphate transport system substrate-binding protein
MMNQIACARIKLALVVCLCSVSSGSWGQDWVVVVNKANANAVDRALVARIYTGDAKAWPDGSGVVAIDLPEGSPVREAFISQVLSKSSANMKALWAQNVFSGKALPPKSVASDDEVKRAVSGNKNAIGYIKATSVDDTVRAVLK